MSITIIIPTKNEEKYIEKCILSIIHQTLKDPQLEIFVCDGKSTDNTHSIVQKMATQYGQIHLINNERETAPFAFNIGIEQSTNNLVMILGAHSELEPDYLETALDFMKKNPDVACLGGILENIYDNELSKSIGIAMSLPFGVGNAHFRTGKKAGLVDTVAFGVYRKTVFEQVGNFDEELSRCQDDEMSFRITDAGKKIYLLPALKAKYYVRASFKKLWNQYYQYGFWKVFVNKKHKVVTTGRQLVPPAFVLFLSLGSILSFLHPIFLYGYVGMLLLYLILAFYYAISSGPLSLSTLRIVTAFLYMHLSYGCGYLKGIGEIIVLGRKPGKKVEILTR